MCLSAKKYRKKHGECVTAYREKEKLVNINIRERSFLLIMTERAAPVNTYDKREWKDVRLNLIF